MQLSIQFLSTHPHTRHLKRKHIYNETDTEPSNSHETVYLRPDVTDKIHPV